MASNQQHAAAKLKLSDNVQATLINGDDENPADVYGNITGRFSVAYQFPIFDRKMVRPGDNIPLSISDVTVPPGMTDLEIEVYLMDYDNSSSDDEIAKGKALFHLKATGQAETKTIPGKSGSVEVSVTWE